MAYLCRLLAMATVLIASLVTTLSAQGVEEFYSGRSIDLYISFTAGGGYDAHGRTLARHMGKHIPGNPTIVPRNRPGAGGLLLANELATTLPGDGSAFALVARSQALEPLFGNDQARFDPRTFNWIGSTNNEVSVCVAWHEAPVRKWQDLKTRGMIVGATGPGADTNTHPRVLNHILGTRMRVISGYPGGAEIDLALERGELEGRCGYSYSTLVSRRPHLIEDNKIRMLLQMSAVKHPALADVPFVMDIATSERDRQILGMLYTPQAMGRPFVAPPGVPADRVAALRAAFDATMRDPEYLADAKRQNLQITPVSGQVIQEMVENLYRQPADLIEAAKAARNSRADFEIVQSP